MGRATSVKMKNVPIYILLTFSLLLQICLTSKLKSASEEKNSKSWHLVKAQSGKIYLQHTKKTVSSAKDTKKNSKKKDTKKRKDTTKNSKRKGTKKTSMRKATTKKKNTLDRDYAYPLGKV